MTPVKRPLLLALMIFLALAALGAAIYVWRHPARTPPAVIEAHDRV